MTQQKQTIMQSWSKAIEQMQQDCQLDDDHIWHAVQDRSHVVSNYRPDYDEWFGEGFMGNMDNLHLIDALDDHFITLAERFAKNTIMNEFAAIAGGIYDCVRSETAFHEFANEETRRAFTLFRAIKGYN